MRAAHTLAVAFVAAAACRPQPLPVAPPRPSVPAAPRLPAIRAVDPDARGAAYLTAIALQLQPGWGQFLDDCRLRLPGDHPLNDLSLAATAQLAIDARGQVALVALASSGNADFDRAVTEVVRDAAPLPAPPAALWSDDDRVHLRWLFARDRRQAGPATVEIVDVELPLAQVVERLLAAHDLARAARRIARAPAGRERDAAGRRLAVEALREALGSSDGSVRRAAVSAIDRANVDELAPAVGALYATTSDPELRRVALELAPADAVVEQLRADVKDQLGLALAEVAYLVRRGEAARAAAVISAELAGSTARPNPIALHALGHVSIPELEAALPGWLVAADARTRAGACAALASLSHAAAWPLVARGLRDRDATVRATCIDAAIRHADGRTERSAAGAIARLRALARDRDRTARARAVVALGVLDPSRVVDAAADPAAEVRAAYAIALVRARPAGHVARLYALLDDRDPDVRATAWNAATVATPSSHERNELAIRATADPAALVRRAAIPALDDGEALERLATLDESAEVRTEAMVALAGRRGRAAVTAMLFERLGTAPPGSAERVRAALAWLLAR